MFVLRPVRRGKTKHIKVYFYFEAIRKKCEFLKTGESIQ
jgi:hypothetical protein